MNAEQRVQSLQNQASASVQQIVAESEDLLSTSEGILLVTALGTVLITILSFSWL